MKFPFRFPSHLSSAPTTVYYKILITWSSSMSISYCIISTPTFVESCSGCRMVYCTTELSWRSRPWYRKLSKPPGPCLFHTVHRLGSCPLSVLITVLRTAFFIFWFHFTISRALGLSSYESFQIFRPFGNFRCWLRVQGVIGFQLRSTWASKNFTESTETLAMGKDFL